MIQRPRRIRENLILRKMVRETRVSNQALIQPLFIQDGVNIMEEIKSMEGQYRYSSDTVLFRVEELLKKGVSSVLLFGIPDKKDELATEAYNENAVVQRTIRAIKEKFPEMFVITDVCLCEYTANGQCGMIENNRIDNDKTLPILAKVALSHAEAGSDMIAPSDMMDGRILTIRQALEQSYKEIPIMSYAVKYSSAFYGPFREAAASAPSFGDRKSYQMDFHNAKEALKEAKLDIEQGADIVMVKPALSYLDVIQNISQNVEVPVAAYSVSGEYAMIKAAAKSGFINESDAICETAISVFRAGATIFITYFAEELAKRISEGVIG